MNNWILWQLDCGNISDYSYTFGVHAVTKPLFGGDMIDYTIAKITLVSRHYDKQTLSARSINLWVNVSERLQKLAAATMRVGSYATGKGSLQTLSKLAGRVYINAVSLTPEHGMNELKHTYTNPL